MLGIANITDFEVRFATSQEQKTARVNDPLEKMLPKIF
jgi:hypothetical protein